MKIHEVSKLKFKIFKTLSLKSCKQFLNTFASLINPSHSIGSQLCYFIYIYTDSSACVCKRVYASITHAPISYEFSHFQQERKKTQKQQ